MQFYHPRPTASFNTSWFCVTMAEGAPQSSPPDLRKSQAPASLSDPEPVATRRDHVHQHPCYLYIALEYPTRIGTKNAAGTNICYTMVRQCSAFRSSIAQSGVRSTDLSCLYRSFLHTTSAQVGTLRWISVSAGCGNEPSNCWAQTKHI